jgi:hypothetical protein
MCLAITGSEDGALYGLNRGMSPRIGMFFSMRQSGGGRFS